MRQGKKCILFVAPVPPPVHGGALAMQYLLEELQASDLDVLHVDSKFAASLDDIGKFSLRKLFRLAQNGKTQSVRYRRFAAQATNRQRPTNAHTESWPVRPMAASLREF